MKSGDLLAIPVDDDHIAIGHVIDEGQEFYLCVYQPLFPAGTEGPEVADAEIALIARTTDELIWHKQWKIIGWHELPATIPRPYYVVDTDKGTWLKTFHGQEVRPANDQDMAIYGRKFSISNISFTAAMRDIHGIEPCDYDFSDTTFKIVSERAVLT